MERKGQAAMEFLMTYGWAILAAIIAIGVLAYFGVFSPGRYVSEMCVLSAPFGCSDDSVANTNNVTLIITNGGGEDYDIIAVNVTNCGTGGNLAFTTLLRVGAGATTSRGQIDVPCTNSVGKQFKGNLEVIYQKVGGTRSLTSTGNIIRKVVTA